MNYPLSRLVKYIVILLLLPIQHAHAIQAVAAKSLFFAPDDKDKRILQPYIELSWEVNPNTIAWVKDAGNYMGKVIAAIEATNDTGIIYSTTYVVQAGPLVDVAIIPEQRIADLKRFYAVPGMVRIQLTLTDGNRPDQKFVFKDSVAVSLPQNAFLSDIQLLDTTLPLSAPNIFEKNGRLQIPKNDNFIPETRKSISYYAEVYQPSAVLLPLVAKTFITYKSGGGPVHGLLKVDTLALQQVSPLQGVLPTTKLASGNYLLNVLLQDMQQQTIASKHFFFQVANKNPEQDVAVTMDTATVAKSSAAPVNIVDLSKTFVSKYTPPQIRAILKMVKPIAEPQERNAIDEFLRSPDDLYSRYFIINFWKARNPTNPEASWKEYSDKVKEVNKFFASGSTGGYETDRGKTWLTLGKPNERVMVGNETGALPYEIWVYDYLPKATGKSLFLFYSAGFMVNDFQLLHSTVSGYTRNPNWRSILYPAGMIDGGRSRAQEYFENR